MLQGLSQTDLAERSGVNLASVYRAEKAKPVRLGTLKKLAKGLDIVFDDLMLDKYRAGNAHPLGVHRASFAHWFPKEDTRPRIPLNALEEYQNESERVRLGALGFVDFFMCPPLIIPPRGPGLVSLELFESSPGPFNAEFYEDGALYVLRGRAGVTIDGEAVELDEGDWVAFKTKDLQMFGPAPPSKVASVLWIGATRLRKRKRPKKA